MVQLPNFVVIGAGRCGTTSLHHYLEQHPEIYMSRHKSPNYFVSADPQPDHESSVLQSMATQWISNRETYETLFDAVREETAVGEVSPAYLQSVHSAGRIKEALSSSTRIIALLRNPVDRAWAHYLGRRRDGLEACGDFGQLVARELAQPLPDTIAFGSYVGCGRYHHFLKPYYEHFPRDNIRIYLFDQFEDDLPSLLRDLFLFLGVNAKHEINAGFQYNRSGVIRNSQLRLLWTKSVKLRTALRPYLPARLRHLARPSLARQVSKPPLDPAIRKSISLALRPDMEQLQRLTGLDISKWLSAC